MSQHTPSTSCANKTQVDGLSNPAEPLLILVGGFYVATSPLALLSGLQAGLHLIVAGFAMFILGGATIWIGSRDFTFVFRNLTIGWGCCLVAFFAWATLCAYAPSDLSGSIYFGIVLIAVTPIPILAFRQPVKRHADQAGSLSSR